jgi:hypothetical protein
MQVKVNGKSEDIQSGSVLDLLTLKKIDPSRRVIRSSSSFTWEAAGDDDYA